MEKLETEAREKAIKCLAKEFAEENKYYKDLENVSWSISYYLNLDYEYVKNILNESNK